MNRKYNFNDESSMSPQAKAAMYAAIKKVMLGRRGKVGKEQWEKKWNASIIYKQATNLKKN